jgi:GNAT superfamily N-acetyltransferase
VAETGTGHVVGFADAGHAREEEQTCDGELYAIYILEPYQRQGIGRLLVRAVARRLLEVQIRSMAVWVLKDNPARAFYERLGGRTIATKPVDIGRRDYEEVCYCWDDVAALLETADSSRSF